MKRYMIICTAWVILASCNNNEISYDASGNFEADEVMVSAQQNGQLLSFSVHEGDQLKEGAVVGQIDMTVQRLQKEQTEATINALQQKTGSAAEQVKVAKAQLAAQQIQLDNLLREKERSQNLVKADAAPSKQVDDINAQIDQLQKQMAVTREQINLYHSNTATQNRSILSEKAPLEKAAQQLQAQIDKGQVVNPVAGTVLTNYALKGEMAVLGKPLYKIADTDTLFLRAYITGNQLPLIKPGQQVQVRVDQGEKENKSYPGTITWISDKSEFTPKTIQTKKERANLVYAIKISVKNDGYLKIGMYGEVFFKTVKK
ncbi:HlyD family efflux transporter periplasmic adaptor subunit [Agriterribacter sp.]|uniref:HlyD family secretion protein n=1 Tax=Agriterribacter sp. TaxID=2821509 RepID=UPI002BC4CDEF|nr:HlyD family efflux transporter periplasmic adaptor subunit [Agriterribacter sp.]HRO44245.1 HlyD family efflux transporter periplasmic adaptor subunit [Agriterribacter sp.]HRQ18866.1 HlyD family efflux transporter periplasmic adaptor subunit [Agriterribacter sp.]